GGGIAGRGTRDQNGEGVAGPALVVEVIGFPHRAGNTSVRPANNYRKGATLPAAGEPPLPRLSRSHSSRRFFCLLNSRSREIGTCRDVGYSRKCKGFSEIGSDPRSRHRRL